MSKTINVAHVAQLTNIPVTDEETHKFTDQFATTLQTVALLEELDTSAVQATPQVTNLENVYRKDKIDKARMFTQQQALTNAKHVHNGYFVVEAVINEA